MAAIGKIRERSGLLIAIVGIALAGFVLNDLFGSLGKNGPSGDRFTTANIDDEQIRTDYFQKRLNEAYQLMEDQDKEVSSDIRFNMMNEMWGTIQKETIIRQQCEAIGLAQENGNDIFPSISMKEYVDLLKGDNRHPVFQQSFPQPENIQQFFDYLDQAKASGDAEQVRQGMIEERKWNSMEHYVKTEQLRTKYNTLIEKSFYYPEAFAKQMYDLQNTGFSVKYYAIPYTSQNMNKEAEDIVVTEEDYETYYKEHINEFEYTEDKRIIDYVMWQVSPSEKDMTEINEKVNKLHKAFKEQPADELNYFVNRNRGMNSAQFDSLWKKPSELSPQIDSAVLSVEDGHVFEPIMENNAYKIVRVMQHDSRPDSMRLSHILFAWQGSIPNNDSIVRTKEQSEVIADSIFNILQNQPERFEEISKSMSDDKESSQKETSGDLDWFLDNSQYFTQFKTACIKNEIGDIVKIETPVGFHILKITGKTKFHQKVRVAEVSVDIKFSKETKDGIYMEANRFAASNKDSASFYSAIEEQELNVLEAEIVKMTQQITGIPESRNIVKWAFGIDGAEEEEVEAYTVSDVFDFPSQIVVAIVKEVRVKGIAPLEEVKNEIHKLVQRDVEARMIMEEVGENPDFYALAKEKGVTIDSLAFFNFGYGSLGRYGSEPYIIGSMCSAEEGVTYGPIKGTQGVFFFIVSGKQEPMEVQDNYMSIKNREQQTFSSRVQEGYGASENDVYKALRKEVEIEDFRYNFW